MFKKAVFTILASILCSQAAQAITTTHGGDMLFVFGSTLPGDANKLKAALTPDVKYVVLRNPSGNDWDDAKSLANVIASADVTTVVHGPCTSLACSLMFLSGKQRQFSGVGRAEASYLRLAGVFYVNSGVPASSTAADEFWRFNTKLPFSLRKKYLQDATNKTASILFFHPSVKTSRGTSMGCEKRSVVIECDALSDIDATSAGIITTEERFTNPILQETADIPTPPPSGFAKLEDPLPVERATDECRNIYQSFLKSDKPRAFAISNRGGCQLYSAQSFRPNKGALDACQKTGAECRLYAVDDAVVFKPFGQ